jgi:hypothetical protein
MPRFYFLPLAAIVLAGCGVSSTDTLPPTKATITSEAKKFVAEKDPDGAKGVIEVRKDAKDGDEVTVVGRVGGAAKPFTEGRAMFLIVDSSLKPTEGCETPWDFCEYPKKDVAAARLSVKFTDDEGKTLQAGAREVFGLKELSTVVVKGKVQRDDKGNVVVVGKSLFIRPEAKP